MAISSDKLKRISFRLNEQLSNKLEEDSINKNIQKSKLLANILKAFCELHKSNPVVKINEDILPNVKQKKTLTFNFYVDKDILNQLDVIANKSFVTRSSLITFIIQSSLADITNKVIIIKQSKSKQSINIKTLYDKGNYASLVDLMSDSLYKNSIDDILLYIRSQQFLGNFKEAYIVTSEYERRLDDAKRLAELKLIKGRIEIEYFRDVHKANKLVREVLDLVKDQKSNNNILGEIYYVLAPVKFYTDDIWESQKMYEKALKYLNPVTSKELYIQTAINLARVYTCLLDTKKAENLFSKIESSVDVKHNHYHLLNLARARTVMAYIQEDFNSARSYINEALKHNLSTRSSIEALNICEESGKTFLFENQQRLAFTHDRFATGIKIENSVRPDVVYSRLRLFNYFVEARYNYEKSFEEVNTVLATSLFPIQRNLTNYIKYSMMYIYGNEKDKSTGELNLKILHDTCNSPVIKQAAVKTLSNKSISPVW
jgi:tetratricopeptide (TPR) repeat protein